MKRAKLIPSILMLVLCVAVLAVGIYAVSPAQNNVTGTISVIASNVEVEITAYLGTAKTTKVSDTITARTSTPVPIKDGKLEFDGSSASSSDNVADITLVLEIKNNSASKVLGAFFLKDDSLPLTLTSANITRSINFDGKTAENTQTTTNLVTAGLPGYTQISAGATIDLVCTLSLNQLTDYDMNVALNLPLVIHEYDVNMTATSVSLISEKGLASSSEQIFVTSGSGSYADGEEVTLSISPNSVDKSLNYKYVWFGKSAGGAWVEVNDGDNDDTSYTFTMSASSYSEYKVEYTTSIKTYNITLIVENSPNSAAQIHSTSTSGTGEHQYGTTITIKGTADTGTRDFDTDYYKKDKSGQWVLVKSYTRNNNDGYTFTIGDDTATDYKVVFTVSMLSTEPTSL